MRFQYFRCCLEPSCVCCEVFSFFLFCREQISERIRQDRHVIPVLLVVHGVLFDRHHQFDRIIQYFRIEILTSFDFYLHCLRATFPNQSVCLYKVFVKLSLPTGVLRQFLFEHDLELPILEFASTVVCFLRSCDDTDLKAWSPGVCIWMFQSFERVGDFFSIAICLLYVVDDVICCRLVVACMRRTSQIITII